MKSLWVVLLSILLSSNAWADESLIDACKEQYQRSFAKQEDWYWIGKCLGEEHNRKMGAEKRIIPGLDT